MSTTQYLISQLSTLIATHSLGAFVHSLRTTDPALLYNSSAADPAQQDSNGQDLSTQSVFSVVDDLDGRTLLGKAVDSVMTATAMASDEDDKQQARVIVDEAVSVFGLVLEYSRSLDEANPDELNEMVSCIEDDDLRNEVCQWIDTATEQHEFKLPQDRLDRIEQTYQTWLSEQDKVSDDEAELGQHDVAKDEAQAVNHFTGSMLPAASAGGSLEDAIAASFASIIPGQLRTHRADSEPAEGLPPSKRPRRASTGESQEDNKPHNALADYHPAMPGNVVEDQSGEEEDAEGEEVDAQAWAGNTIESAVSSHLQSALFGQSNGDLVNDVAFVSPLPPPNHSSRPSQQRAQQQQYNTPQVSYGASSSTSRYDRKLTSVPYNEDDDYDDDEDYQDSNLSVLLDPSRMAKSIARDASGSGSGRKGSSSTEISSTGQTYTPPNLKPFVCTTPGCTARYKQANGLKYHRLHGKCNIRNGSMMIEEGDDEEKRYVCHSAECGKRYKNLNGLKYHYSHAGSHGIQGLQLLYTKLHPDFSKKRR
ncbi:hypothetical protein OIO90_000884 [Microbotryomycetes sp. JL221]|nr:hypothetical protein OIO90_000884 [Microbotryomycetes sp. JL221]